MKSILISLIATSVSLMALNIGQSLPPVTLSGKDGGYADGKTWHSKTLVGSTHLVIYMDPDKRKNIDPLMKVLRQKSSRNVTTVAIVNLAATWMPNRVLISKLNKQKSKMKRTKYVFDKKRVLVSKWELPDESTSVIVVGASGKVLYHKSGKLTKSDVANILKKTTH